MYDALSFSLQASSLRSTGIKSVTEYSRAEQADIASRKRPLPPSDMSSATVLINNTPRSYFDSKPVSSTTSAARLLWRGGLQLPDGIVLDGTFARLFFPLSSQKLIVRRAMSRHSFHLPPSPPDARSISSCRPAHSRQSRDDDNGGRVSGLCESISEPVR
jgi:hypothetical protein